MIRTFKHRGLERFFSKGDHRGILARSAARIERMFRINALGPMLCCIEAIKRMSTRYGGAGGVIVNLSSAAARIGSPGEYVDYAASKAAIEAV